MEDEKVKAVIAALTTGHYMERAARLAGLNPSTVYLWLDKGAQGRKAIEEGTANDRDRSYVDIADAITKAKEAAAHRAMMTIQQAAQAGTWQAAAWYLERTDREHYGRVTQVTGADNGPVQVAVSVDELRAKLSELIEEHGAGD